MFHLLASLIDKIIIGLKLMRKQITGNIAPICEIPLSTCINGALILQKAVVVSKDLYRLPYNWHGNISQFPELIQ